MGEEVEEEIERTDNSEIRILRSRRVSSRPVSSDEPPKKRTRSWTHTVENQEAERREKIANVIDSHLSRKWPCLHALPKAEELVQHCPKVDTKGCPIATVLPQAVIRAMIREK